MVVSVVVVVEVEVVVVAEVVVVLVVIVVEVVVEVRPQKYYRNFKMSFFLILRSKMPYRDKARKAFPKNIFVNIIKTS